MLLEILEAGVAVPPDILVGVELRVDEEEELELLLLLLLLEICLDIVNDKKAMKQDTRC